MTGRVRRKKDPRRPPQAHTAKSGADDCRILGDVRRLVALPLCAMLLMLASLDPAMCPDGCTAADLSASHLSGVDEQSTGADCVICHGIVAAIALFSPYNVEPISLPAVVAPDSPLADITQSIEHPPRFA